MKTGTGDGERGPWGWGSELGAFFTLAADRFDALGQDKVREIFNDRQHTRKAGARINAECVVEGIRRLRDVPLAAALLKP